MTGTSAEATAVLSTLDEPARACMWTEDPDGEATPGPGWQPEPGSSAGPPTEQVDLKAGAAGAASRTGNASPDARDDSGSHCPAARDRDGPPPATGHAPDAPSPADPGSDGAPSGQAGEADMPDDREDAHPRDASPHGAPDGLDMDRHPYPGPPAAVDTRHDTDPSADLADWEEDLSADARDAPPSGATRRGA